jgi:type II secretory pathway pseudopilin PulG
MVVVGIILLLVAVVIPRVQPNIEESRLREAARGLNVMLAAARVRAIESGRPVGVVFERLPEQPNACRVVHQIELPPPYAGETTDARVRVAVDPNDPNAPLKALVSVGAIADNLVRPGDRIRFGHQGPWFRLAPNNPESNSNGFIDFDHGVDSNGDGFYDNIGLAMLPLVEGVPIAAFPWPQVPNFGPPVPFQIERMPNLDNSTGFGGALLRSNVPALQLPDQVVIDLGFSGLSPDGKEFEVTTSPAPPVVLIFSSAGGIEEVYAGAGTLANPFRRIPVIHPIFFLVGSWDRMPSDPANPVSPSDDGLLNWQDGRNLWVGLNPQNALVTVAPVFTDATGPGGLAVPSSLQASRRLVRESQIAMGGR